MVIIGPPDRTAPGVYPVRGHGSAYLSAPPTTVTVAGPVTDSVNYAPTDRPRRLVARKADAHLRACVSAGRKMGRDCPLSMRARAEEAATPVTGRVG